MTVLTFNCAKAKSILVGWVFANGCGDRGSLPGWVIPKTKKCTWCHLA